MTVTGCLSRTPGMSLQVESDKTHHASQRTLEQVTKHSSKVAMSDNLKIFSIMCAVCPIPATVSPDGL